MRYLKLLEKANKEVLYTRRPCGARALLVSEYSETFELIAVEIKVGNTKIRVMTGYGPQESWNEDDKMPFFTALEEEIAAAELEGREVLIAMDANSKLGPTHIEG